MASIFLLILQGELAHRVVKQFYRRTNKINPTRQITKLEHRSRRLRRVREAIQKRQLTARLHAHHVPFSGRDPLPNTSVEQHHHISDSRNYPLHLMSFIHDPPKDPAKKVVFYRFIPADKLTGWLRISFQSSRVTFLVASWVTISTAMKFNSLTKRETQFGSSIIGFFLQKFFESTTPPTTCVAPRTP